jgi:hypothetical protein
VNSESIEIIQGEEVPYIFPEWDKASAKKVFHKFWKKHGVAVSAVSMLVAWTCATCGITGAIVKHNTTMEITAMVQSEMRQEFQDYLDQQEAARAASEDPLEAWIKRDAEAVARVLYGVKDNSDKDLKTYCWCVFNRVDNPSFANSLEEVVSQPDQWMRYSPNNPVLESLYQLAYTEVKNWRTGEHRPVSNEYVFMNWTPTDICLRDSFRESSRTHYWRCS